MTNDNFGGDLFWIKLGGFVVGVLGFVIGRFI
jgi:hypothetical protein